jgi:adenylate cyclase
MAASSTIPQTEHPEAVRRQLDRLLASPQLVNSAQLCRFLRYLVDKALVGETGALKENLLGIDVFERGDRFDPRTDPVVRVEARRLRSKLDEYYATAGLLDELIIRVPKGTYIPVFEPRVAPASVPLERKVRRWKVPTAIGAAALIAASLFLAGMSVFAGPSTLAVLPFANVGMDAETEYFADGLTDELTDLLGRTEGLRVVARSSAYQYKGKVVDARRIGKDLKADVLLEGSIRKDGQNLRVSTQLIDARTGYQIWSQTSEREWTQVFAMQQAIAASIAAKLRLRPAEGAASRRTPNLESYNLYLKGRYLWNKRTVPAMQSAIATFREALDKRSGLRGGVGRAGGFLRDAGVHGFGAAARTVSEGIRGGGARRATRRHAGRGARCASDGARALRVGLAGRRALTAARGEVKPEPLARPLQPFETAGHGGAPGGGARGNPARAGFGPALADGGFLAWMGAFGGAALPRSGRCISPGRRSGSRVPVESSVPRVVVRARGKYAAAIDTLNRAGGKNDVVLGELAHALGRAGRKAEAARILEQLTASSAGHYVSPYDLSRAYEGLGRRDEAMSALMRACDDRSPIILFLKVEPVFAEWRSDPRFPEILRRLHLE